MDAAALAKARGVRVVQTRCKARFAMPPDATPLVTLTPTVLLLGRESLLTLPSAGSLAASGIEARHKHGDPTSARIVPIESGEALTPYIDTKRSFEPEPRRPPSPEEDRAAGRITEKLREMDEATRRLLPKHIAEPWHPSR